MPTVSRVSPGDGLETDFWRFTQAACARLFGDVFGADDVRVSPRGNVFTGAAFLRGMATEELPRRKLDVHDPYFPVVVTVRAVKREVR